ncbi:Gamma-glutamyltranspeptidase precursor [Oligella ureolytica]|uniref:Glutathione hydrolase proenzyme n=1 Tax=Oligella ureolytica TaxID=90244 RepID=A0A378XF93_9BURK|nr:gamma-glutamyltransferase [Oligella ureolytica]QPT39013.1 gamma-glutamyltransferase [Oligella ureolytica]SUA54475.1 Gamma-glutamyltranspeptidase precursor [Oligella ureolytica]SUA54531.1 Gamma-glutamyltranspeptidase precursor [Oligella ureolytica]
MKQFLHTSNPRKLTLVSALAVSMAIASATSWAREANTKLTAPTSTVATHNYDYEMNVFHPVQATNGMVATEQNLASQIGLEILKNGGNAVDAAVAIGFSLAVSLPNAGNIGGGGFMLVHDAKSNKTVALDFREKAPAAATETMYQDENGEIIPRKSWYTHQAIGVPGTVAGLTKALEQWGSLPLAEVMQPAIDLAEQGYEVSPTMAKLLQVEKDNLGKWPTTKAIFFDGDEPLALGDTLVQKNLSESLKLIAKEGADAFYKGAIAEEIVRDQEAHDGLITKDDLASYEATEREVVRGDYRGYEIVSMPLPSSGGIHIIQMLNAMEHLPIKESGVNSAKTISLMAETMKRAYADRSEYLGDSDFVDVPIQELTSKEYAKAIADEVLKGEITPAQEIKPGDLAPYESDQTTHYSVVDKEGNAVAVTYTLNLNFGSGIVAGETGILMNNEMDDFSAKPGVPNAFGLIGGSANAIEAGKRPLSSMTPTMVLKDSKPWLVTGSPGGARIITTVLQQIVNAIDFGMNPAAATNTPRFHHQWLPDELRLEVGFSPDTIQLLENAGYDVSVKPSMGRTQTIQIIDDTMYGYSDPRNPDGSAIGY